MLQLNTKSFLILMKITIEIENQNFQQKKIFS